LYGTLQVLQTVFDGNISKERETATLDCSKLHFPLTLRQTENGDRFAPFGMRGTKLVSDYLTDRKKSLIEKQQQLVVTDAKGNIVWLVGERPAAPYCIKESTTEIVVLEWEKDQKTSF
jgi:tRNA(Ile)-lysidine synthase